jgi:hypothetical protein
MIASLQPLTLAGGGVQHIHARVADTNVLLDQLVASVRRAESIAFMSTIRDGALRVHVAAAVVGEVEEKIVDGPDMQARFQRCGITRAQVREEWNRALLPRLRVVDVGVVDRVELAAVTDIDDLPTAQLAAVLGPGSTWSRDSDLTGPGLAEPYVLELVIAIREVCVVDVRLVAASQRAALLAEIGSQLVGALARLDPRRRLVAAAVALVAITAIAVAVHKKVELRHAFGDGLQRIGAAIVEELAEAYGLRSEWADRLPSPLTLLSARPERTLARVLAAAPTPLRPDEIGHLLATRGAPVAFADIGRCLEAHPMFVRANQDTWQFGRHVRLETQPGHSRRSTGRDPRRS